MSIIAKDFSVSIAHLDIIHSAPGLIQKLLGGMSQTETHDFLHCFIPKLVLIKVKTEKLRTNFVKEKKILVLKSLYWPLLPMAVYFNLLSEASYMFFLIICIYFYNIAL